MIESERFGPGKDRPVRNQEPRGKSASNPCKNIRGRRVDQAVPKRKNAMDAGEFIDWRQLYQTALDQLKDASLDLPKGDRREVVEKKIKSAEDMLARADVKLAKDLGMKLCDCTWPPQIMRWEEASKAHVCPNPRCGRRRERPKPTGPAQSSWVAARRGGGGGGWMDN